MELGSGSLPLNLIDYLEFFAFVALIALIGFLSGRGERANSTAYFLAGRQLPWYAIGGSFIAANISTEQFIGMVGSSYILGVCTALWEWLNAFTYLFMIFIFVPFLFSSRVVTIPEYLARRYGQTVRQIFAAITVVANIVIFMAAVLYTGGLALSTFFGWPLMLCIAITGVFAGGTAVYGGLSAVAWTGLFTAVVKFTGVAIVTCLGLLAVSGDGNVFHGLIAVINHNRAQSGPWAAALQHSLPHLTTATSYNRLSIVQAPDHPLAPWTGLVFVVVSVSIWYNVLNQFIVQRILGAKNLWHARMGVVFAGYAKVLLPLITVLPGLILFALHPQFLLGDWASAQHAADRGFILLIKELLPIGMRGILLAVLFSAVQATVNSVVNSTATVLTYDLYKGLFRPDADDRQMVRFGVMTSILTVVVGILVGIAVSRFDGGIFQYMQTLNAFFAPPFAAIFVLGILWSRANSVGAIAAIAAGFLTGVGLKVLGAMIAMPGWYYPFANQAGIIWLASIVCGIAGSLLSVPRVSPSVARDAGTIWDNPQVLREGLGVHWYQNVWAWAAGFFLLALGFLVLFSNVFFPASPAHG